MKTLKLTSKFILLSFVLSLFTLTSCKTEDDSPSQDTDLESVQKSTEIDLLSDAISTIIEETYVIEENISGKTQNANKFTADCVTKTVTIDGLIRTVTLDFGEGCVLPNGNELSGIITITYERNPTAQSRTITYEFSNFYFNTKHIEGGGSIVRELSNTNGNPQSTINQNITVTWQNGVSAHRVGEKVREWILGFGSGTWGDNVFLITGNWTTEFPNGNVNSGIVITPLRRELSCRFIVSGTVAINRNNHTGTLDFGDGSCDNQAIFTDINGNEHAITLR